MSTALQPQGDKRQNLAVRVFEILKREIVSGTLSPNAQLSEAEVSERLGVSRTPVREALIKLSKDGLVKIIPQVGSFVAPISIEMVREAQFIREHLECALIVDATRAIDKETISFLKENIRQQNAAALRNDWLVFIELDEDFHRKLANASGHRVTWDIIQQSKVQLDRVRLLSFRLPAHMKQMVAQHTMIVDALERRDEILAGAALRVHLREIIGTLEKLGLENTNSTNHK